jgi:hypothetical protein
MRLKIEIEEPGGRIERHEQDASGVSETFGRRSTLDVTLPTIKDVMASCEDFLKQTLATEHEVEREMPSTVALRDALRNSKIDCERLSKALAVEREEKNLSLSVARKWRDLALASMAIVTELQPLLGRSGAHRNLRARIARLRADWPKEIGS